MTNAPETEKDQTTEQPTGIVGRPLPGELLNQLDWQAGLPDLDLDEYRWGIEGHFRERAEALESDTPDLSRIYRLLSAAASMQLNVNGSQPFIAALQMRDRRSAAPEDFDGYDVAALQMLAEQATSPWLRARLADVAAVVGPVHGLPSWKMGALAARAYLELARCEPPEHDLARRDYLQRAMELGWRYLKRDEAFHEQLWETTMTLLTRGIECEAPGVAFPLAREIVKRNAALASKAAAIFEQQADQWLEEQPSQLAADTYGEAAKLWHAAKDRDRARANHLKSAETLIALARGPGQAMLQADWMLEGIAILRRNHADRPYIRELQAELADIRRRITGEMKRISHEIDVSEIVGHVRRRVTADNFGDALLQVAYAFWRWSDAKEVRNRTIETRRQFVFQSLFRSVSLNNEGVPVSVSEPFDAQNEVELEKRMISDVCQFDHSLLARVAIGEAIDLLQLRFEPTLADIVAIVGHSPVTPQGHEWTLSRGLLAGLNHDWHEAAVFLIPQAEPFVRAAFKRNGIHTLSANADGAEEEKSLNELLDHPEVASVFHPDVVLELKALLTHKAGHNLRNRYGHGLVADDALASIGTVVLWWTMLRLILWPYRERAAELIQAAESAEASETTETDAVAGSEEGD